jgi:hypothetical protein
VSFKEDDALQVINKNGAKGSLDSLKNAALIPLGETYQVFKVENGHLYLVGMGGVKFKLKDFKKVK